MVIADLLAAKTLFLFHRLELPPNRPRVQRYEDDRMRRYRVDRKTAAKYKEELGKTAFHLFVKIDLILQYQVSLFLYQDASWKWFKRVVA